MNAFLPLAGSCPIQSLVPRAWKALIPTSTRDRVVQFPLDLVWCDTITVFHRDSEAKTYAEKKTHDALLIVSNVNLFQNVTQVGTLSPKKST